MTANLYSKTLIANWVEEVSEGIHIQTSSLIIFIIQIDLVSTQRQCAHLEEGNRNPDGTLHTKLHRAGHKVMTS